MMAGSAKSTQVFLLLGVETGKKAAFVESLHAQMGKDDPEKFRFYAFETGVPEVLSTLLTPSLFISTRLIEYRCIETVKTKSHLEMLARYIRNPAPDTVLVLESDAYSVDKTIEAAVPEKNRHIFYEMQEGEKRAWIRGCLNAGGVGIEDEAIDELLEITEGNSGALGDACSRLLALFPKGSCLDAGEIEDALAHTKEEDPFSLCDAVIADSLEEAIGRYKSVQNNRTGDNFQIISALAWTFRRGSQYHEFLNDGYSHEEAQASLQMRSRKSRTQGRALVSRYSRQDCERILSLVAKVEGYLRSGLPRYGHNNPENALVEFLIAGIIVKKGKMSFVAPISKWNILSPSP